MAELFLNISWHGYLNERGSRLFHTEFTVQTDTQESPNQIGSDTEHHWIADLKGVPQGSILAPTRSVNNTNHQQNQ